MELAARTQKLPAYFFAELDQTIARQKAEGKDIIRLDIGSPDMAPPQAVVDSLCESAAKSTVHGYQPHLASEAYRQAWADFYKRNWDVTLDPDSEIIPLLGSKEGIFHFSQVMVDPGDVVLMPEPHYPTYLRSTQFVDGQPYGYPLRPENDFLPDLEAIPPDVLKRTKMMWINYPNNPTGATATLAFFERLVDWARQYDILLCSDAAYCQVYFDGMQPPTLLQVPGAKEVTVEFNSMSKSFNMAGWRMGALVGNPRLLNAHHNFKTSIDSGQFRPMVDAATTALHTDAAWIEQRNLVYQQRRDIVVSAMQDLGVKVRNPLAAMYVWIPLPEGIRAFEFALALLNQSGVSVAPGTVFGEGGEGYFRISIVQPQERLAEAMQRIKGYWQENFN